MNEASWPIFIAAPFISPSVRTIVSAVSRWRASSFSSASLARPRDAGRPGPRVRAAWPPSAVPSFAERAHAALRDLHIVIRHRRRVAAPGGDRGDEPPGLLDRLAGLREKRPEGLERVRLDRVELQPRVDTVGAGALGELVGVLALRVARGALDQHRGHAREVLLQRVQEGLVDRVPGEVVVDERQDESRHRLGELVRPARDSQGAAGDVDPGTEPDRAPGHRLALGPQAQEQRHAEARHRTSRRRSRSGSGRPRSRPSTRRRAPRPRGRRGTDARGRGGTRARARSRPRPRRRRRSRHDGRRRSRRRGRRRAGR